MAGTLQDAGVAVTLARQRLRRQGHRDEEIDSMTSHDVILQEAAAEAESEAFAEEAKVQAWFQQAARGATAVRVQQAPEVLDG